MATKVVNKKKQPFRIFFLVDDEDQTVHIEEAEEIDFRMIKRRLERGEEVFITRKRGEEIQDESR